MIRSLRSAESHALPWIALVCVTSVSPTLFWPTGAAAQETPAYPAAVLLDGPCIESPEASAWLRLRDDQRMAERAADRETAIDVQKQIVRLQCGNSWRWARLAELYLQNGQDSAAVAVLTHMDSVAPNELEEIRRRSSRMLEAAWGSDAFAGSALERRLAERLSAHASRMVSFRAVLDTLGHRPPEAWVAPNVCPFECCAYRTWPVLEPTPLLDRVQGDSVVALLRAGTEVEALTGDVHLTPLPIRVLYEESVIPFDAPDLEPGDIAFVLDYMGEGVSRLWHEGRIVQSATEPGVRAYCPAPASDCWGEYFYPDAALADRQIWWVKVRTLEGIVGWTNLPQHFGNKDACG